MPMVLVDSGQFGFGRGDVWVSDDYRSAGLRFVGNFGERAVAAVTADGTLYLGGPFGQTTVKIANPLLDPATALTGTRIDTLRVLRGE